jgi:predicted TPR repeat methyltransferase
MTEKTSPNLAAAYALKTPEDSLRLYADWADSYDESFAQANDYILPRQVATQFAAAKGTGPILDVGAGTGLCAVELTKLDLGPIDGTDISQDMLDISATKGVYRRLFTGDLTARLQLENDTYAGITSSGTFTSGHVGPDAIDELLRITQPGGLLALSINAQHFVAAGFEAKLSQLAPKITDLRLPQLRFYGDQATGDHKDDQGYVALFRKR